MRVYSRDELDRLKVIKHLVEDEGVNLAGVQRLLTIAEAVRRLRPLMNSETTGREARRRLMQEIDRITELVGL